MLGTLHSGDGVDRLLGGAGGDPGVMVHVGTNEKIEGRWSVFEMILGDQAISYSRGPSG